MRCGSPRKCNDVECISLNNVGDLEGADWDVVQAVHWLEEITMSTGVETFEALYNELDDYMRKRLGRRPGTPHTALVEELAKRDGYFRERADRLTTFARLRNALIHNVDADRYEPIAEPHPGVVKYEAIVRYLKNPPLALKLAVPHVKLFTAVWASSITEVLATMRTNAYGLTPIVSGDQLEAVFLDCTLINAFVESNGFEHGTPKVMRDLRAFIDKRGDRLGCVEYLAPNATVRDAEDRFSAAFVRGAALRALFVTSDATPDGEIAGLITGYDLLGHV